MQEIPQDGVLEDQGRMTNIEELLDNLRTGYQTASIVTDWDKKRKLKKFGEKSTDSNRKLGNTELYELGEISETVRCRACLKKALQRLIYCACCVCFMPFAGREKTDQNSM